MNEEIAELQTSVIAPFNCPQRADALGVSVSNVILHGPPGTGKSHLAEALASELNVPSVLLSGADLQSRWINESASKVNDLFKEAEQVAAKEGGALIFLDELDSVLQQRDGGNSHAEDVKVVNEFLNHLENTDSNNIVFIGATNRLQELDSASTRSGRIDAKIEITKPDKETREAILHTQLADRAHSLPDEQVSNIAEKTEGAVAADLTQIVEDAASEALQRNGEAIQPCDLSTVMSHRN
jgi:transitional endoplasmic reticulum ATPase